MGDLSALNTAVDSLVANEAAVASELGALRDEVAQLSAGTITQEQIDAVAQRVTDVAEKLTADVNAPDGGVGGTGGDTPPAEAEAADAAPPAEGEAAPAEGGEAPAPAEGEAAPVTEGGETPPPAEGGEAQPA